MCGYLSGFKFANQIGLTTQIPFVYEIVPNKASRDYRKIVVGRSRVVLRKPRVTVSDENYRTGLLSNEILTSAR